MIAASGVWADLLHCQLTGGQAQIQRNLGALTRRILLHHTLQVQQFGPKYLQPFAQFFDHVIDFFFEIRSLAQLIADVDIHAKPQNTGSGSREALSSLQFILYLLGKGQRQISNSSPHYLSC